MHPRHWSTERWPAGVPAIGIAAAQVIGTYFAARGQPDRRPLDVVAIALLLAGPALLVFRGRHPVAVLLGVAAVTAVYFAFGYPYGPIFASGAVATISAVVSGHRRVAWVTIAALYAARLVGSALSQGGTSLAQQLTTAGWLLVLLVAAEQIRVGRERGLDARRARDAEARRRAGEERLRIARELHDVLGHHISLISVQAGVALHLIDERPEQVRESLTAIKQASGDALAELRSVLDVLRDADEAAPRSPGPSLARLDDLVSNATAAGIAVRTEIDGSPRPLPASVDGTAFRVVQEALTNVVRHAAASSAVIRIGYGDRELTIEVADDGTGSSSAGSPGDAGSGTGIAGMRERVVALGGELSAGPRLGRGFRVLARLPLDGRS